jgi:putative acetyltransferase
MTIRAETAADYDSVRRVNRLAFDGDVEAALVDALRAGGHVLVSLAAEEDGEVVGHILFSRMRIHTANGGLEAASLAPVAVLPAWQNRGIGSALVRAGLEACRGQGERIAVVLGHAHYYPRFGFSAELARRLHGDYSGESWMALELVPGALDGVEGAVEYADPFSRL